MIPDRFKLARELNGLTQNELRDLLEKDAGRHVAQSTIAEIETGRLVPSSDLAFLIGEVTGFPVEFFEKGELLQFPSGSLVLYRAKSIVTAREEAQVRRHAQLLVEIIANLSGRIELLDCRIPQLDDSPPAEAAQITRATLGLAPDLPIENLIRRIEHAGVIVLALPHARDPVDAFSAWVGVHQEIPCIATLSGAPGDRQRFSVAHELGHLVLHRAMRGGATLMEDEANRFASEFLTPRVAMETEISRPVTLTSLQELKKRWRVSMRSLVNRAYEVEVVTARQRSYLFKKLNAAFGGRGEPTQLRRERPRALQQMFEMIYGLPIDYERAAFELNLHQGMIQGILSGYQHGAPEARYEGEFVEYTVA